MLADFFDYIGGTSTGAIIATGPLPRLVGVHGSRISTAISVRRVFRQRKFPPLRIWSKYPGAAAP